MRIAVDLLWLTGDGGGVTSVARSLFPELAKIRPDWKFLALTNVETGAIAPSWFPGRALELGLRGTNRAAWAYGESLRVDRVAAAAGADLLHCPSNFGPIRRPALPTIITVHDVIAHHSPQHLPRANAVVLRRMNELSARHATRIVTPSRFSADDVEHFLGVPTSRIDVALNGPSPVPPPDQDTSSNPMPAGRPYILSSSNRLPHKNFDGLLRSLATIPQDRRPRLALTGGAGGSDPQLMALLEQLGLADDVEFLGWVAEAELAAVLRGATAYVCPSHFEGFGMPVLDAMLAGVPVVCSDIPVLREVGGDAVSYADSSDPDDLGQAIDALVGDAAERSRLVARGVERAKQFTWRNAAESVARSYELALGGR